MANLDNSQVDIAIREIFEVIRKMLPYKTGNLANNAYKLIKKDATHYDVTLDLSIAPYGKWINEAPTYRTYQYWNNDMNLFIQELAQQLKGNLELGNTTNSSIAKKAMEEIK